MPSAAASKRSKTSRFPVARIKKIMQMDEEVGKLASATPVMISKSLECFLQLLVDETTKEVRSRRSKKITAHHVKSTVNNTPTLDFLLDTVSRIPDPPIEAPSLVPSGSGSRGGHDAGGANAGPSKPRRSTGAAGGGEFSGPGTATITSTGATRGRKKKTVVDTHISQPHASSPSSSAAAGFGFSRSPLPAHAATATANANASVKGEIWDGPTPTPRNKINLLNDDGSEGKRLSMSSPYGAGAGNGERVKAEPVYGADGEHDGHGHGQSHSYDDDDRDTGTSRVAKVEIEEQGEREEPMDSRPTSPRPAAPAPASVPSWQTQGTGEGGKGMFDDYEEEDDY